MIQQLSESYDIHLKFPISAKRRAHNLHETHVGGLDMDATQLLKSMNAAADALPAGMTGDERRACLDACNRLQASLETPLETCYRFLFGV